MITVNTKLVTFVLMTILYFASRALYMRQSLVGEEGEFWYITFGALQNPEVWINGRIAGKFITALMFHPAFMFDYLKGIGQLAQYFIDPYTMEPHLSMLLLRFLYSLNSWIAWGLLIFVIFPREKFLDTSWRLLFLSLFLSPIALAGSVLTHIDSSYGILSCALVFAALIYANRTDTEPYKAIFFAAMSAFMLSLGKQEWTICLVPAICIVTLQHHRQAQFRTIAFALSGSCLIGHGVSYLLQPQMYWAGLQLILSVTKVVTFSSAGVSAWPQAFLYRLPFICTIFLIWAILPFCLRSLSAYGKIHLLFALFLFLTFFSTSYNSNYRYFITSFFGFASFVLAYLPTQERTLNFKRIVKVVIGLLWIHAIAFILLSKIYGIAVTDSYYSLDEKFYLKYLHESNKKGCLAVIPSGIFLYAKGDYLSFHNTPMENEKMAKYLNSTICADTPEEISAIHQVKRVNDQWLDQVKSRLHEFLE